MAEDIELIPDGYRTDGSDVEMVHGVECVGRIKFLFKHPILEALANKNADYAGLKGGVALTGFKLEEVAIDSEGLLDNAKLIPLLNGDTMTLTNSNKSGRINIACIRSSAGVLGGDLVAIADFIRSQGDSVGGTLEVTWTRNGEEKGITFKKVCVVRCPPLKYAGNDLPNMGVILSYATYNDKDYPKWS